MLVQYNVKSPLSVEHLVGYQSRVNMGNSPKETKVNSQVTMLNQKTYPYRPPRNRTIPYNRPSTDIKQYNTPLTRTSTKIRTRPTNNRGQPNHIPQRVNLPS